MRAASCPSEFFRYEGRRPRCARWACAACGVGGEAAQDRRVQSLVWPVRLELWFAALFGEWVAAGWATHGMRLLGDVRRRQCYSRFFVPVAAGEAGWL